MARNKLAVAEDSTSLSATYGRSREEKLKQMFSAGSFTTLHHIMHLDPATGIFQGKSLIIPAVFVKDIRSMNAVGRIICKRITMPHIMCEVNGPHAGKKVYGAQVLFADPRRTPLANANFNTGEPGQTQNLLASVMTRSCACVLNLV